jgi:hypothetical protein
VAGRDSDRKDEAMTMSNLIEPMVSNPTSPEPAPSALDAGTRVEVRNRLDGRWTRGFEIVAAEAEGYRLRRLSDGDELPLVFDDADVRPEKRRSGTWWY